MLHVRGGQDLLVEQNEIQSSVIIYPNASATFTSPLVIPTGATASFFGTICGVQTIEIYGTVSFSASGTTCSPNLPGKFNFTNIIVHNGATLTSESVCDLQDTIVCLYPSGIFNNSAFSKYIVLTNGLYIRL
jgi:hypothetical protein